MDDPIYEYELVRQQYESCRLCAALKGVPPLRAFEIVQELATCFTPEDLQQEVLRQAALWEKLIGKDNAEQLAADLRGPG